MAIQSGEELFLSLLSDSHAREQHMAQFWDQLSQNVQDPDIRNIISVRAFLTKQDASNLEKCFQILGKQPSPPNIQFYQSMADNFRRQFDSIQHPGMKALYALWAIRTVQNWAIGEYMGLTAMADAVGNRAVTNLLDHTLADKVDFVATTRDFFRDNVRQAIGARAAGRAA
ncbi:MAG TPA: DUF892 family protein [Chloroflexota bacterium]|nr:DUF892 family protein [Chloroflexota bacterium]